MALKFLIQSLDEVAESLQDEYKPNPNGAGFVLDTEGIDPLAQKAKLDEFRDNNRGLKKQLDELKNAFAPFEGLDPKTLQKATEMQKQFEADEEKKLFAEGNIQEIVKRRTAVAIDEANNRLAEVQKTLGEKDSSIRKLTDTLAVLTVDREVSKAIEAAGVKIRMGALDDVTRRAREVWRVNEEGKMVPIDPSGDLRYGSDGNELTMKEFVQKDLVEHAGHLFEGGTGGGAAGGKGPGVKPGVKTIDASDPVAFGRSLEDIASGKAKAISRED